MLHKREKKMNYGTVIFAFVIGMITSFIFTSDIQKDSLIGEVIPESGEMEAVWYPE